MQQGYTKEMLKVQDEVNHAQKVMLLTFSGLFLGMVMLGAIQSFLWDSIIIDIIVYSFIIPAGYVMLKWTKASDKLQKMFPKKEYLLIQTSEKHFKKINLFFGILGILSIIIILGLLIVQVLYDRNLIQFQVINYRWIILALLVGFIGNIGALLFAVELRQQYLKMKEKEPK